MKKWNELTQREKVVLAQFYPEDAKNSENAYVRLKFYELINFKDKDAKYDEYYGIRLGYHESINFKDIDAKYESEYIREEYYRHNRHDRDCLKDKSYHIRKCAKTYFDFVDSRDKELITVKLTQDSLDILNKIIKKDK